MLQFISKKLRDQKLLNGCLFFGIVILIAVLTLIPLFQGGALDDVIQYDFERAGLDKSKFPAVLSTSNKLFSNDLSEVKSDAEKNIDRWNKYLELPVISTQIIYRISGGTIESDMLARKNAIYIGIINDMERVTVIDIETKQKSNSDFTVPCYMSKNIMDDQNMTIGETISFPLLHNDNNETLKLRIVGLIEEKYDDTYYWYSNFRKYSNMLVVNEDDFKWILENYNVAEVFYEINENVDYRNITTYNINATNDYLKQFAKLDMNFKCEFTEILDHFDETKKQVQVIIISILIPLIVLLFIFIYMIADRITDAEEMEINVLRSRGISRGTIIRQYILKSVILTMWAAIPGLILGYLMCKAGATSVDFLTFVWKKTPSYIIRPEVLIYIAAAFPIAIILTIIPIIRTSNNTILNSRGSKAKNNRNGFIEKYFIDIILLGLSLYLLYNYNRQKNVMISEILAGKVSDPMCLINAELFTFGAAFFLIRFSRLFITLIFKSREKKWKPATLAAFLEVIRTRRKSWVISVFLIITIAMGIYNANLAKTVNHNKRARLSNDIGVDAILIPQTKIIETGRETKEWMVVGPDYASLTHMKDEGIAEQMAQVYRTDKLEITSKGGKVSNVDLFAISSMDLGRTAEFDIMLNDHHWFHDLNSLTMVHNGVIISRNMAVDYKLQVGDSIDLKLKSPVPDKKESVTYSVPVQVVAIIDAFPGYKRYELVTDSKGQISEKENYLAVVNDSYLQITYGELPPEIWIKFSDKGSIDNVCKYLDDREITYKSITGLQEQTDRVFSSAVILITNGLFNISFIISLIICVIGFLIYWLTSINSRQMYFGVYRAMGLGMKGINSMLVKEHIFSTLTSLVSSVVVGMATSVLFINLISCIYLPEKHTIPLIIYMSYSGLLRIGIIMLTAIVICMLVIVRFIKKMNITEAIKMGEQ